MKELLISCGLRLEETALILILVIGIIAYVLSLNILIGISNRNKIMFNQKDFEKMIFFIALCIFLLGYFTGFSTCKLM